MNSYSPYYSSSTSSSDKLLKRFRLWKRQYLHVVIYTSLFWIFLDVFFIMLFSDCTKQVIIPCSAQQDDRTNSENSRPVMEKDRSRHPKFGLNRMREENETMFNRNNIINRKKLEKSRTSARGFIAKWFGSDSGWNGSFQWKRHFSVVY